MAIHGEHIRQSLRRRYRSGMIIVSALLLIILALLAVLWVPAFAPLRAAVTSPWKNPAVQSAEQQAVLQRSFDTAQKSAVPQALARHTGTATDCADRDCVSLMVNGDLLFHPGLWNQYAVNPSATDGSAFDFTELFASLKPYIDASDIAVCEFETPIAPRGGPYTGYPIFAIPPEVVDAAAQVGYQGCTHATNHSWDQGSGGIALLRQELSSHGLAQVGSYTSQDQIQPMILHSANHGPTIGVVTGTVSLNGFTADEDWMVDRLRAPEDPEHDADMARIVQQAQLARQQGADIVVFAMHSLQEYIDYADSWQIEAAHELAQTGAFNLIYGAGSHSVQPIEQHNGTWIIYGTGNTVTEDAPAERIVNNQGMTARIIFSGKQGIQSSWRVQYIDWVGSANAQGGKNKWCSLALQAPDGVCWSAARDAQVRERLASVIYAMGADRNVVRPWTLS